MNRLFFSGKFYPLLSSGAVGWRFVVAVLAGVCGARGASWGALIASGRRLTQPPLQLFQSKTATLCGQVAVRVEFVCCGVEAVLPVYCLLRRRMRWKATSIPKPPNAIA